MAKHCEKVENGKRCKKDAGYNFIGKKAKYCNIHLEPGMKYVVGRRCPGRDGDPCNKFPSFSFEGQRAEYCAKHKAEGMENVKAPRCAKKECKTQPRFNLPKKRKGKYCVKHKDPEMEDVYAKKCEKCKKTRPTFNFTGETIPVRCAKCILPGMKDIMNPKCKAGCGRAANFNYETEAKGLYCFEHIPDSKMINVNERRFCKHKTKDIECSNRANFNFPSESKGLYCKEHIKPGMKNVTSKRCEETGCDTIPCYNFEGQKGGRFCYEHKSPVMVDVKNKKCDCGTYASHGFPGSQKSHCSQCKTEGMIFDPRRKCIVCTNELALYGVYKHLRCGKHKKPDDINFIEAICSSCNLLEVLDQEGLCKYCNPETTRRVALAKQRDVKMFLDNIGFVYNTYDKSVDNNACGRDRPDFVIECSTHSIVLEVDEHQHKDRPCECEQTRMVNISQSLGMPTIFIRYNPDEYKIDGKTIDLHSRQRYGLLRQSLEYFSTISIKKLKDIGFLSVIYLFYNGFDGNYTETETILQYES